MAKTIRTKTHAGEHYAILQMGVSIWNQWRAMEPFTIPNLRSADLTGFHLENINLCRADLRGAHLGNAYLYEADFQAANLSGANLTRAGLIGANLHRANLTRAILERAYLAQSDLSNANLTGASLQKADLRAALLADANFSNAHVAEAEFTGCFDLTEPQMSHARDSHLACFDTQLSAALCAERQPVTEQLDIEKEPVGSAKVAQEMPPAITTAGMTVETLSSSKFVLPLLSRLSLRPLSKLNARRNAAVTNVSLS